MKTLIGVIQSEANQYCQTEWIANLKNLNGDYEVLIVENSFDDDNFDFLKSQFKHVLKGPYLNEIKERIVTNRNIVLNWFREHKEYDNLLFLDSDIFPPKEALQMLLKDNKDIIGTVCWIVGSAQSLRCAWNFFREDVELGKHLDYVKYLTGNKTVMLDKGDVIKIKEIGLGCTLFNGNILRKNKIEFKSDEFELNEDFTFIRDLQKEGYKSYIDMKVCCFHNLEKFGYRGEQEWLK